jgi:hypothetical protein
MAAVGQLGTRQDQPVVAAPISVSKPSEDLQVAPDRDVQNGNDLAVPGD